MRIMSKRTPARRKLLLAKRRIAAVAVAFAAALGIAVLSGGTAYASGTNCAAGTSGLSNICMHIDGAGNVVDDAVGSVLVTSTNGIGEYSLEGNWVTFPGHIQVVNPVGDTLCNSNTITLSHDAGTSCESEYQGATYTGNYCTILWAWTGGDYVKYGEECLNVFD